MRRSVVIIEVLFRDYPKMERKEKLLRNVCTFILIYTASHTRNLAPATDLVVSRCRVKQVLSAYISCEPFTLTIQHVVRSPGSFYHSNTSYVVRSKDVTQKAITYALPADIRT